MKMQPSIIAACLALAACNTSGKKEHGMMNCPSDVAGARTELANTADGVDVIVTAPDADAQRELVMLAEVHAAMREPNPDKRQHKGQHGGPGLVGYCPVIHNGTRVTFDEIDGGVRIHVVANSPDAVTWVQEMSAQRVAALRSDQR